MNNSRLVLDSFSRLEHPCRLSTFFTHHDDTSNHFLITISIHYFIILYAISWGRWYAKVSEKNTEGRNNGFLQTIN